MKSDICQEASHLVQTLMESYVSGSPQKIAAMFEDAAVEACAGRLLGQLRDIFKEMGLTQGCSMWILRVMRGTGSFEEFYRNADAALYAAKGKGKGTSCRFEK